MSEPVEIPEEFPKIIKDFVSDIINTFPEYEPIIMKWWKPADFSELVESDEIEAAVVADAQEKIKMLFNRCVTIFPERFFDILYQNEDIFKTDSTVNTEFLPGISFKYLWQCDISEKTKETIWKYLQMVLLSIIGSVKNKDAFGDTAKLFKTINEDEFKGKLQETLEKMQSIFENTTSDANTSSNTESESDAGPKINMENMPSADDIHGHITGMLGGKLGDLAREIAEETAENLDIDMENVTDVKDVFQKLFKNPGKLMNLVKNVGDKLDSRIKSGEINEKELMSEASDIMSKMKNVPGMGNIQEMLGKMGLGGLGGKGGGGGGGGGGGEGLGNMQEMMEQMGGMDGIQEMMGKMGLGRNKKVDVNAMEAKLERNKKNEQMKERMKKNMILKQQQLQQQQLQQQQLQQQKVSANALSDEQLISVFSTGEKVERTLRNANPNTNVAGEKSSKKKKSKK